jgi:eukaryotic-like serine/threonine-protein kinase
MGKLEGKMLGAYRVISQVGAGGMATIYKAYQSSMDRTVALKVLPEYYAQEPQFIERFYQEARTIAKLEHPNILPVYDFGEQGGITYLVMRFLDGGTLQELMDKQHIGLHQTADILVQVCAALDYAHRKGIIHRDVKPSNVLIDREGAVYLSDFGIAKVLEGSSRLTQTGVALGTPAYMSPEQCMGTQVDQRSDIYSLGVILYEMAVGYVPFRADTPMAVLFAHVHEPLPLPQSINPAVPDAMQNVILKALAKKADDRYQTAAEMGAALRRATPPEELKLPERRPAVEIQSATIAPGPVPLDAVTGSGQRQAKASSTFQEPPAQKTLVVDKNAPDPETNRQKDPLLGRRKKRSLIWIIGLGLVVLLVVAVLVRNFIFTVSGDIPKPTPQSIAANTVNPIKPTQTLLPLPESSTTSQPTFTMTAPTITLVPTLALGVGSTRIASEDGMLMVYVPDGSYLMGSDKSIDAQAQDTELPQHSVYLDAYWIDQTDVTNAMYARCVEAGSCTAPQDTRSFTRSNYYGNSLYADFPVIKVNWNQADAYCRWAGRQLPTEAQWEKAARGADGRIYPWGNTSPSCDLANTTINGVGCVGDTSKVGSYKNGASPYGALDMAGNVWEWIADWYDDNYYQNMPLTNPTGPNSGQLRILRGGAFVLFGRTARSADRAGFDPNQQIDRIGFRCTLPILSKQ